MTLRMAAAFTAYALIALLATVTLSDWRFRSMVWIIMAGLALKTWIAATRD